VNTRRATLIAVALASAACAVGPRYHKPSAPVPESFKERPGGERSGGGEWKPAAPADAAARSQWWEVFGDPVLAQLEEQIAVSNQDLAQAEAQYRAARALVGQARAALLPTVGVAGSVTRSSGGARASTDSQGAAPTANAYQVLADASWELDLFGGIRRNVEAGVASAQASAADVESVRLALQAELALHYFTLRGLDAQRQLLESTVDGYRTALQLTRNRYAQGVVSCVDVAQAETQLETTRVQAVDLGIARAQREHAIAVLVGKAPADFAIAPAGSDVTPPEIPVGLPSELLERRPDVAAAERRVAAANARIGVARAAYFPTLTLGASGGYESSTLSKLFSLPHRFWSLGPDLLATVFNGGKRRALNAQAQASYDGAVAAYRASALTAFQEVEDNLAALRILAEEAQLQGGAVTTAERALALAKNRYQGGVTTYLEVVTAQNIALANERAAVDLLTRRMTATVGLVRALGGGWQASDLFRRSAGASPGAQSSAAPGTPSATDGATTSR
jgi:NodT family efflux transporter outer membrane factor (OMF) lipoprotein